ncbi:21183_t:CDS:2 [Rhizophagus irregularis]|nr:21183_t:CDS:2 [Rhizophagus irregularis]
MSSGRSNKSYYIHYYNHREDPNIPFPNIVYPNPPPPPLINKYCDCRIMSIRKQVKSGRNMGRLFYSCSKFGTSMHDDRCNFFCWEEPRIIKTPLKYSKRKRSLNNPFSKKSKEDNYSNTEITSSQHLSTQTLPQLRKENNTHTTPLRPLPTQTTLTQIFNSSKSNRNYEISSTPILVDKKVDQKLEEIKGELDKTKLEYNELENSNKILKRKLRDEEERNESLIKSNKRLRKDLDENKKNIKSYTKG